MFKLPSANYKFTDKRVSPFSVMSVVLSLISFVALLVMLIMSYNLAGEVAMKMGMSTFLALIFSLTALVFSILTYFKKNVYHIISHIGTVISIINLVYIMYIYGVGMIG